MNDFILPDIGEGIVECELLEWLVKEGDIIEEDQPVAEVMTDKATVQIPAMHAGKVTKLYYKAGDIAKVHQPLFCMTKQIDSEVEPENLRSNSVEKSQKSEQNTQNTLDFILPDIGEGIVECEIVKWLVSEGDSVEEDQAVVEVMTDKALVEIPAKYDGRVTRLYYQQGEIAKVHSPLYCLQTESDANAISTVITNDPLLVAKKEEIDSSAQMVKQGKALASPAVRRLARENSLDIAKVLGSGNKGRVLKQDIQAHLNNSNVDSSKGTSEATLKTDLVPDAVNLNKSSASQSNPSQSSSAANRVEPIRGIKALMAKQMVDSVSSIPHFSVSDEVGMDALMAVRQQLKQHFEDRGSKLSFMPFFIKALSLALKQYPIINSQVNADCSELTYINAHNIGIAVDSKIGLVVPNIKNVQHLSLLEVAQEVERLVNLARNGKLSSGDLKGGTISISNIGVLGGTTATPVINKPESAIVALGKIQRLPRFDVNDNVIPVNIMHISWSGDHRTIDGATMVKFSNLWKSYLENPIKMLPELC